ncbi:hypothetical protein [Chitinophaga qingshengii]|uniref:Lipoprotein n=1 Tax=Chitinophaga qingshengii TaxID=1569794 RepID=A0ABR7TR00_9BACT|nr:hypothetical protein [Chitinophaga qingshengii]MBC9932903.1 hypothetical protein [Chitinophaga qingshengii]
MTYTLLKRRVKGYAMVLSAVALLMSCSKHDDPQPDPDPPPPAKKGLSTKITVSVTGFVKKDHTAAFTFIGKAFDKPDDKTIWKVDGTVRPNEDSITIKDDQFTAEKTTYVVETNVPVASILLKVKGANNSKTQSFKIVWNGPTGGSYSLTPGMSVETESVYKP